MEQSDQVFIRDNEPDFVKSNQCKMKSYICFAPRVSKRPKDEGTGNR